MNHISGRGCPVSPATSALPRSHHCSGPWPAAVLSFDIFAVPRMKGPRATGLGWGPGEEAEAETPRGEGGHACDRMYIHPPGSPWHLNLLLSLKPFWGAGERVTHTDQQKKTEPPTPTPSPSLLNLTRTRALLSWLPKDGPSAAVSTQDSSNSKIHTRTDTPSTESQCLPFNTLLRPTGISPFIIPNASHAHGQDTPARRHACKPSCRIFGLMTSPWLRREGSHFPGTQGVCQEDIPESGAHHRAGASRQEEFAGPAGQAWFCYLAV